MIIGLLAGAVAGFFFGMFIMALMVSAAEADKQMGYK